MFGESLACNSILLFGGGTYGVGAIVKSMERVFGNLHSKGPNSGKYLQLLAPAGAVKKGPCNPHRVCNEERSRHPCKTLRGKAELGAVFPSSLRKSPRLTEASASGFTCWGLVGNKGRYYIGIT